jgi:hypothetical protein
MDLGHSVERRECPIRSCQDLGRYKLRLAGELLHRHRDVFLLIELFENLDVFWTWINHQKFNTSYNSLLIIVAVERNAGPSSPSDLTTASDIR